MKIYLAGAIDHVSPEFALNWRKQATEVLKQAGYEVLDPTASKDLFDPEANTNRYTPKYIVETDKAMIDQADILLAEISKSNIPYIGTSMEILYAWERGKRVIVWGGSKSYWIRYHASLIFDDLESVLAVLEKIARYCEGIG